MVRYAPRKAALAVGLAATLAGAVFAAPAGAASVKGDSKFKMISGLSRVGNCVLGDLTTKARATWSVNPVSGAVKVDFNGATNESCLKLATPGNSDATLRLSYRTAAGAVLASKTIPCHDVAVALETKCALPASTTFANVNLAKVVLTFTQTNPAAPASTTTIVPPTTMSDTDLFRMISGLSRVRSCQIADMTSQAKAEWTYTASGLNSVKLSGSDHVCVSMFRPGDSDATAVVTYKDGADATLATVTVPCHDTAIALPVHCPFPASTDKTIQGLERVTIDFTQTAPAAGTSSINLDLGD